MNLLTIPGFYDIALRDFGLLVAAVALGRLAVRSLRPAASAPTRDRADPLPAADPARLRVVRSRTPST